MIRHHPAQIGGALPGNRVATVTIERWRSCSKVAKGAGHRGVRAGQRKPGRVVVKYRAQPRSGGMARLATLWITGSDVIRDRPADCRSALPGKDVAGVASCGSERVVVADVAGNAGRRHRGNVQPRQGKPRAAVVERGSRPVQRRVANRAVLRESRGNVIGNVVPNRGRALPFNDVAPVAGCGLEQIVVVQMAGGAGRRRRRNVHPRQGKPRRAVIEGCCGPTHRRMADRTIRRGELRTRRRVHRIIRLVPGR